MSPANLPFTFCRPYNAAMEIPPTRQRQPHRARATASLTALAVSAVSALSALSALTIFATSRDDTKAVDGARTGCAVGGALNGCQAAPATVIDACNRLVDCGSIPVDNEDENGFDWGRCVDQLEARQIDQQRFTVSCIVASACDELRTDGSPNNPFGRIPCFAFGQR